MSCPACFSGTIHDGTPAGTETVLHGLPTYIASPAPSEGMEVKAAVVIVSDALGWKFTNTRCLADAMAAEGGGGGGGGGGWRVYVPDFMDGDHPTLDRHHPSHLPTSQPSHSMLIIYLEKKKQATQPPPPSSPSSTLSSTLRPPGSPPSSNPSTSSAFSPPSSLSRSATAFL